MTYRDNVGLCTTSLTSALFLNSSHSVIQGSPGLKTLAAYDQPSPTHGKTLVWGASTNGSSYLLLPIMLEIKPETSREPDTFRSFPLDAFNKQNQAVIACAFVESASKRIALMYVKYSSTGQPIGVTPMGSRPMPEWLKHVQETGDYLSLVAKPVSESTLLFIESQLTNSKFPIKGNFFCLLCCCFCYNNNILRFTRCTNLNTI